MGNGHAILSPSASHRWERCPASIRMCRDLDEQSDSVFAQEGTDFHTLCEIKAAERFLGEDRQQDFLDWLLEVDEVYHEEMFEHLAAWLLLLEEYLAEHPAARLHLEVKVDTGVPGSWGTADVVIEYPDYIRVIDIKYGKGLKVEAPGNSQLRLYGVGALETVVPDPLTIQEVINTIWQPRMGNLSEEVLTRRELVKWRNDLVPVARLALTEDAPFGPSQDACRFCPAAGICAPRARYMLEQDFGDPNVMTGEQIAEAYERTPDFKRWITDIEDTALKMAYEEAGSVPGFKVVLSGGRRTITDQDAAIDRLVEEGFAREAVERTSIQTLGVLDKVVGSDEELQQVLGDLLVKSEGRLSLAPVSDKRPEADAHHSAKTDFAGID